MTSVRHFDDAGVMTRKEQGWVCTSCNRLLERQAAARLKTYRSERLGTVTIPEGDA